MYKFLCVCFVVCFTIAASQVVKISSSQRIEIAENTSTLLTCLVEWHKTLKLKWISSTNKTITSTLTDSRIYCSEDGNKRKLIIKDVQSSDSGQWRCELDTNPNKFAVIQIETWKNIQFVDIKLKQEPAINTDALIECKVVSRPIAVVGWERYGKGIVYDNRFLSQKNGLLIRKIQESDNGQYTCSASMDSKSVYDYRVITVTVTIPPVIAQPIASKDKMIEGKSVKITCKATGKPAPTYKWKQTVGTSTVLVTNTERVNVNTKNGILEFKKLQLSDKGDYTCFASNSGGDTSKVFQLDVKVPAKIIDSNGGKGSQGGEATLMCKAKGNDKPQILFFKKGSNAAMTFPESNKRILKKERSPAEDTKILLVVFKQLRPTDTGDYKCSATNSYGSDETVIHLDVEYRPMYSKDMQTKTFTWAKSPKAMKCVVTANPAAVIKWMRKGTYLKNSTTYEITTTANKAESKFTSSLKVKVDADKYGDYICEAENTLGAADAKTIELLEAKAPDPPQSVSIMEDHPTALKLVIKKPRNNGGVSVTKYIISYLKDGKGAPIRLPIDINRDPRREEEPQPTTVAHITNLKPSTKYTFAVSAVNDVGEGNPNKKLHTTKDISKPSRVKITSGKSGDKPEEYRLVWETPHTGGLPLKMYKVQYREVTLNESSDQIIKIHGLYMPIDDIPANDNSVDIKDLLPNRTYQVSIVAVNKLGPSVATDITFRTAKGGKDEPGAEEISPEPETNTKSNTDDTDDGETEESSGVGGIPTGAVIAIFVILILITLIVVDVYCYVRKGCGVIYTIRTALCAGDDSSAPISDIEAGDKAGEPLLEKKEPLPPEEENKAEEELVEKEPDYKVDTPIIKLEEPEDMDGVEKGELETEEKGEEGGKAE